MKDSDSPIILHMCATLKKVSTQPPLQQPHFAKLSSQLQSQFGSELALNVPSGKTILCTKNAY